MVKRLCACGCDNRVTHRTESRHLQGQGPLLLASSILLQSRSSVQSRGQGSQPRWKSSHRPAKQELIGRLGPLRRALASRPASANSPPPVEELASPVADNVPYPPTQGSPVPDNVPYPSVQGSPVPDNVPYPSVQGSPPPIYPDDGDFPMGEAVPSGVDHDTTQLATPTHTNATGNHDDYGLSKLRRSHRIADYIDRVGQQRWGSNHVRWFILDDDDEEEEEEEEEEEFSDEEEYSDGFEEDDEYVMLGAEPGQEGVSVWDLLGEGFLKEASKLGLSLYLLLCYWLTPL
jgi:hypothetical protein